MIITLPLAWYTSHQNYSGTPSLRTRNEKLSCDTARSVFCKIIADWILGSSILHYLFEPVAGLHVTLEYWLDSMLLTPMMQHPKGCMGLNIDGGVATTPKTLQTQLTIAVHVQDGALVRGTLTPRTREIIANIVETRNGTNSGIAPPPVETGNTVEKLTCLRTKLRSGG